ncbi:hypothetical protein QVD17_09285 [Tagetes erecta]|uniref:Uncharacterized protein n=1 Tax=Tagetes erecta TaxID=13708 RepID=A0AAD8KZ22_TARER|nr:hypothetical protein QVD17_09285 [Tagetes erecta]
MSKGTKRKASPATRTHDVGSSTEQDNTNAANKTRRYEPHSEPHQFFQDHRELEDLWKQAFPVGTEWDQIDLLSKYNWNFSNLEKAFEKDGVLHNLQGKSVFLFSSTEPQLVSFKGESKVTYIPVVVAVVSPFAPSDKIAYTSVQMASEEIFDMKRMKMDWVPYIPLGKRDCSVERFKSQIFVLNCVQRRAGLKHMNLERVEKFKYCIPYIYHPLRDDETQQNTIVHILYPVDPEPIVCQFDWDMDELEDFTNDLILAEELSEDHRDAFKEFVRERVRERRRANREERERRANSRAELSAEKVAAFENMKIYKFYPVATPDTPDVSNVKEPFINRYYGKAHQV